MVARITKPLCVLCDANVIIKSHQIGMWHAVLSQCRIVTGDVVAHTESLYYKVRSTKKIIDLEPYISDGQLTVLSASAVDIASLLSRFPRDILFGLHEGERELLALINAGKTGDCRFCSSDGIAIEAMSFLGAQGVSFEKLLEHAGCARSQIETWLGRRALDYGCSEEFFIKHVTEGKFRLIDQTGKRGK